MEILANILRDLRFAWRVLRNSPGFVAVAVVTLGLGIAASTTVFSWIDTVLLRPITGVRNAHELVALEGIAPDGGRLGSCTHPDFRAFQQGLTVASGVVASHTSFFTIGSSGHPARALGEVVSANFFTVLGVKPFLGRLFLPEEDRDAPGASPIAVISHRLWTTQFGADPGIVGRAVRINGHPLTVVGVTAPDFRGTFGGAAFDVWVPLSMILEMGALNTWAADDWNARFLDVIVRLKPGVTIEQAREEARVIAARIAADHPDTHKGIGAWMVPMWRASYGLQASLRDPLYLLTVVCVLVLLIACANVANLLMARAVSRQREFGVRMALGASRGRVVQQQLAEVLPLAGAGAIVGALLARWLGESLYRVLPFLESSIRAALEPLLHVDPSANVLAFTVLISVSAAVLSTILPAFSIGRVDIIETLKEGGRSGTSGVRSHRARGALVVLEVALATLALCGAGLAVRAFQKFATLNPGFDSRNVLVAHFYLSTNGYSLSQEKQFCRNLRLRLEAAPGIQQVSYADSVPLSFYGGGNDRVEVEGFLQDRGGVIFLPRSIVAPGYFSLMRIPLLAGRDFTEQDDKNTLPVIIINQTFAKKYFDGKDPIGRRVRVSDTWSTVVGMVKDSKYRNPPEAPMPFFYGPFRQIYYSGYTTFFCIRAGGDLEAASATLRREVTALALTSGLYDTAPLSEYTQGGLFAERIVASLLSVLGMLAMALAAVGLYCVMAYAVSERTHEFGIRMALGAQRHEVLGLVLREGLVLTLPGLVAGVAAAVAGARLVSSKLNLPLSLAEPAVFGMAALALVLAALLASFVPARRATKVDPMKALRAE
ncbi:MAG: ABC transporter permease [Terriglobia bacterium]|jgi:predicted permease